MSLQIVQGDLLGEHAPKAIAQGCNAQGIMGAGIALQIRERFPAAYEEYRELCRRGTYLLGDVHHWRGERDGQIYDVFNCCTQVKLGRDARLVAIETALCRTLTMAQELRIEEIGIPKIGCGIGGLSWPIVLAVLQRITLDSPVDLFVYDFDSVKP